MGIAMLEPSLPIFMMDRMDAEKWQLGAGKWNKQELFRKVSRMWHRTVPFKNIQLKVERKLTHKTAKFLQYNNKYMIIFFGYDWNILKEMKFKKVCDVV
jgi:hypothetical protein